MKIIKYEINGKFVELEVEDSFAEQYEIINQESKRNDWKHDWRNRKNNTSLEVLEENGFQFVSSELPADERMESQEEIEALRKALMQLSDEERILIERVYFKGEKHLVIAAEFGVDRTTIVKRIQKILKKIEKIFR